MTLGGWAKHVTLIAALALLAGCGGQREPQLMNVRSNTTTPDEFGILPTKPLETPPDYSALPPPTPGGSNRVDPTPNEDAIAALGGNPAALRRASPAADRALLAHAARFGATPTIRQELAAADLEFRRRHDGKITERWFNVNVYFRAYRSMALDKYAELARWRQIGVRTPSAPPPPVTEN